MMKRVLAFLLALVVLLPAAALADSGAGTIAFGAKGENVLAAQERLQYYGYYNGKLDGVFGNGVLSAVKIFQKNNGLTVDGKIGPATLALLNSENAVFKNSAAANTLQQGMTGEAVKELQRKLRETYYYSGTIDGIFGVNVTRAVKAFQASTGLQVDGRVGSATYDALFNGTAKIFNGALPRRTLSSGDRGYDVYVLQNKLASLNYLSITPSGYYGTDTVAAVKKFQTANGLKADGKAGPIVRRYLWPTTINDQEQQENDNKGTADDPYKDRSLRLGMHGSDVANAQMRLKAAGYLLGNADGIFGPKTKQAVVALQKDYNLKQDGVIGSETWAIIKTFNIKNAEQGVIDGGSSVGSYTGSLRKGSSGASVKKLQNQLILLGYLAPGGDDGKFGAKTELAVRRFQRAEKLKVDGVAGTQTFVRINERLGTQWDVPVG